MTACMTTGSQVRFQIASQEYEVLMFDDKSTVQTLQDNSRMAMRGTRENYANRVNQGLLRVGYTVRMQPTAAEWGTLLPWLGFAASGGSLSPAANLTTSCVFDTIVDKGQDVFKYGGCVVDKWILRGQTGGALELIMVVLGKTFEDDNWGEPAAIDSGVNYAFTNGVLTYNSTGVGFNTFQLMGDNKVKLRYQNSITADCAETSGLDVTLQVSVPYNPSTKAYLTDSLSAVQTAVAQLVFSNNANSLTAYLPTTKRVARPNGEILKHTELRLPLTLQAYGSGTVSNGIFATPSIVFTNYID